MAIATDNPVRRTFLHGALSLFGLAGGERDELAQATAFVDGQFRQRGDLIAGPISLLQRQYGLGYGEALALAQELQTARVWQVYRDGAGMRVARRVGRA
jgi:hypothetical protein